MNKIRLLAAAFSTLLIVAVVSGIYQAVHPEYAVKSAPQHASATPTSTPTISQSRPHAKLGILFRHTVNIAENESVRREYQRKTRLSDEQFAQLVDVARDHEQEVAAFDAQAKQIIERIRIEFPPGRLPPGVSPPPASPELSELQNRRNEAALRHRDRFRERVGEEGFQIFSGFLDTEFKSKPRSTTEVKQPASQVREVQQ